MTISATDIEVTVQRAVETAMKEVQQLFNEKMEQLQNRLTARDLQAQEFENRLATLECQFSTGQTSPNLTTELNVIRMETRVSLLTSNDNEQYSRRNNIRIHGIQIQRNARSEVVNFTTSVLHLSGIEEDDIEAAHSVTISQLSSNANQQAPTSTIYASRRPIVLVRFLHCKKRKRFETFQNIVNVSLNYMLLYTCCTQTHAL